MSWTVNVYKYGDDYVQKAFETEEEAEAFVDECGETGNYKSYEVVNDDDVSESWSGSFDDDDDDDDIPFGCQTCGNCDNYPDCREGCLD